MKRMIAGLFAVLTAVLMSLGIAAPANASTGYQVRACYAGSERFQVSSWIESNGYKTYHWNLTRNSHASRRAIDVDKSKYFYAYDGFFTTSDRSLDKWTGEWWLDSSHTYVMACSVTV